ncbi:MAG: hypothetical protein NTU83_03145, partial [Candidatus Hydrogenedentes bacterium]|nr:hypothetical protein [Candidatus Hydrogenedentota bacterium]
MEAEESKHCSCTRRQFVRRSCALASLALLSPAPGCVGRAPFPALGPFALEPPASVYPDDAFSRPFAHKLIAFETMMGVSLGGTLLTRPEHFFRNELHLAEWDGKTCTRWSVQTRDTDTWPLVIQETIRRRPEAVSFWVRNDARVPMTFFLHYGEHAWIPKHEKECTTWFVGEGKRVEPGAGRELHFSFAAVHRATESNHTEPVFPG